MVEKSRFIAFRELLVMDADECAVDDNHCCTQAVAAVVAEDSK